MILDRKTPPPTQPIQISKYPQGIISKLANGLPWLSVEAGMQPVSGVDLMFCNQLQAHTLPAVPMLAMRMLSEGTRRKTAHEISEAIAYYGAFWEIQPGASFHTITLYSLNKHLASVLDIIAEVVQESVFPEREFDILKENTINTIRVNMEKTAYLANVKFKSLLFGEFHPYGYTMGEEHLQGITVTNLRDYYSQFISQQPYLVITAGNADAERVHALENTLGNLSVKDTVICHDPPLEPVSYSKFYTIAKPDSTQASIRMGLRSITRRHPQYADLLIATEILGGYFGSRLMKNIREEKGLTYGIYAQLANFKDCGMLVIGSDVNKTNTTQAIDEVLKEIRKLQHEPVSEHELQTVKNYMLGQFAGQLNTPFSLAELVRNQYIYELDADFYPKLVQRIQHITAEEVMQAMQAHWRIDDMLTVVAGSEV